MEPRQPQQSAQAEDAAKQISAVVLAKQFFLSGWHKNAMGNLFSGAFQARLDRMAEETREEAEELQAHMGEWAEALVREGRSDAAREARCITRHDVLMSLYQMKEAMADALRVIALSAPSDEMRQDLERLAGVDDGHAKELLRMLAFSDRPEECPESMWMR